MRTPTLATGCVILLVLGVLPLTAPVRAPAFCADDVFIKGGVRVQAVQTVWQDDPVWGAADIQVGPLESRGDIPLAKDKASLAFGTRADKDGDPLTIDIGPVSNTFLVSKPVKVELRLFDPGGGFSRRVHLTTQSWTLPAATPGDPCNAPGNLDLSFPAPTGIPFRADTVGWNWLEAEVVNPDGSAIADADPSNQDGGHSFEVRDTHGLQVLFKPLIFSRSAFAPATFTSTAAGTPGGTYAAAAPFVRRTYPVAESEFAAAYDPSTFTVAFERRWLGGLWVDEIADDTITWQALANGTRHDYLAQLVVQLAGGAWAAGQDRVVVLTEPGFLRAFNALGLAWSSVNKHVVFVSWNTPGPGKTTAHELGHSYGLWLGGTEEYSNGVAGNNGGAGRDALGYSVEERLAKTAKFCFMGAGGTDAASWIDKPDYRLLLDRFAAQRDPEILGVRALLARNDSAYLEPLLRFPAGDADVNGSEPGEHAIVLKGSGGATLASYPFAANFTLHIDDVEPAEVEVIPVTLRVPWVDGTTAVEVTNLTSGAALASRAVSATPPAVALSAPLGGETVASGPVTVSWAGSDPDGDALSYTVLWSGDGGATWSFAAVDTNATSAVIDASSWTGGAGYRVRVLATDGIHTTAAESGNFTVTSPSFTLTATAPSAPLAAGGSIDVPLNLSSLEGFSGLVNLSATSAPLGLAFEWPEGATASLATAESAVFPLRVVVPPGIPAGVYTVNVTGESGVHAVVASFQVAVTDPAPPGGLTTIPVWIWPLLLGSAAAAVAVLVLWRRGRRRPVLA